MTAFHYVLTSICSDHDGRINYTEFVPLISGLLMRQKGSTATAAIDPAVLSQQIKHLRAEALAQIKQIGFYPWNSECRSREKGSTNEADLAQADLGWFKGADARCVHAVPHCHYTGDRGNALTELAEFNATEAALGTESMGCAAAIARKKRCLHKPCAECDASRIAEKTARVTAEQATARGSLDSMAAKAVLDELQRREIVEISKEAARIKVCVDSPCAASSCTHFHCAHALILLALAVRSLHALILLALALLLCALAVRILLILLTATLYRQKYRPLRTHLQERPLTKP